MLNYISTSVFSLHQDFFQQEDVFNDVLPACQQVQDIANKVFEHNAEHVLARFVQYIFDKKLAVSVFL